jgi:sugar O-acyltransferase (sialic acid O-acetyltransferase NeuD family)
MVGAGGFGRVVLEHAQQIFDCAFVDDGYETGTKIYGAEVVGKISVIATLFGEYQKLVVVIGNNALREKMYKKAAAIGYSFPNIIVNTAYISTNATIGTGCIILNNAVVQSGARIGNGVILNSGVEIHLDSEVEDYVLIYTNSVVRTYAHVGRRAHIGSTLTIGNNVTVPDDAVVKDGCSLSVKN